MGRRGGQASCRPSIASAVGVMVMIVLQADLVHVGMGMGVTAVVVLVAVLDVLMIVGVMCVTVHDTAVLVVVNVRLFVSMLNVAHRFAPPIVSVELSVGASATAACVSTRSRDNVSLRQTGAPPANTTAQPAWHPLYVCRTGRRHGGPTAD